MRANSPKDSQSMIAKNLGILPSTINNIIKDYWRFRESSEICVCVKGKAENKQWMPFEPSNSTALKNIYNRMGSGMFWTLLRKAGTNINTVQKRHLDLRSNLNLINRVKQHCKTSSLRLHWLGFVKLKLSQEPCLSGTLRELSLKAGLMIWPASLN